MASHSDILTPVTKQKFMTLVGIFPNINQMSAVWKENLFTDLAIRQPTGRIVTGIHLVELVESDPSLENGD